MKSMPIRLLKSRSAHLRTPGRIRLVGVLLWAVSIPTCVMRTGCTIAYAYTRARMSYTLVQCTWCSATFCERPASLPFMCVWFARCACIRVRDFPHVTVSMTAALIAAAALATQPLPHSPCACVQRSCVCSSLASVCALCACVQQAFVYAPWPSLTRWCHPQ